MSWVVYRVRVGDLRWCNSGRCGVDMGSRWSRWPRDVVVGLVVILFSIHVHTALRAPRNVCARGSWSGRSQRLLLRAQQHPRRSRCGTMVLIQRFTSRSEGRKELGNLLRCTRLGLQRRSDSLRFRVQIPPCHLHWSLIPIHRLSFTADPHPQGLGVRVHGHVSEGLPLRLRPSLRSSPFRFLGCSIRCRGGCGVGVVVKDRDSF